MGMRRGAGLPCPLMDTPPVCTCDVCLSYDPNGLPKRAKPQHRDRSTYWSCTGKERRRALSYYHKAMSDPGRRLRRCMYKTLYDARKRLEASKRRAEELYG